MIFSQLRRLSIRAQLVVAIALATAVAGLAAGGFSLWREVSAYAEARRIEMRAMAGLFGAVAAEAVSMGDAEAAARALNAMTAMPGLTHVRLVGADGATLAEHGFGARLVGRGDGLDFASLLAGRPASARALIRHGGETVGAVEILASTADFRGRLLALAGNAALATALALALGFLAADSIRRRIAGRLGNLAAAMTTVERTHDYDLTLADDRPDEIGALARGFNSMLHNIRIRDARLADHAANLEEEVARRTHDLVLARQAADDANAAKSQFLATMSHEIRTPLNGVMVMADLLASADLAPRDKRNADVIARSCGSLLAIINDILDYSKIEAGKIELEAIEIDIADVIDDAVQLFASKAEAKGLDLAAFIDPALGRVTGDPVRLGQIVGNLVNNAIKFTHEGNVFVEAGPDPSRPGHALIRVIDTGIGIPADKLGRVFERFSQADQSTTRQYGGTGLGLSICQRLVEVMGGEIGVESVEGEGSCFWFSAPLPPAAGAAPVAIPRFSADCGDGATALALQRYAQAARGVPSAEVHIVESSALRADAPPTGETSRRVVLAGAGEGEAERRMAQGLAAATLARPVRRRDLVETVAAVLSGEAASRPPLASSPAPQPRFRGARVLVVDDQAVNREVAVEALRRFGIEAETAADGHEAVARTAAIRYDLVLMDGSMPGLDGFAACRAIRARERETGAPRQAVVALTAHAIGAGADAWRAADMDGLLLKPFKLADLEACLLRHLVPTDAAQESVGAGETELETSASAGATDAAAAADDALDPDVMRTFAMLAERDAAAVRRIVDLFMRHAPEALARLEAAATDAPAEEIASAAHALKSMAASAGARALAALLAGVEAEARSAGARPDAGALERAGLRLAEAQAALARQPWMSPTGDGATAEGEHASLGRPNRAKDAA